MKVFQQPGYVLHTRPYAETSLLVDVFSREHGRCMLLCKGARRQKGGLRGIMLPFKPLLFSWSGKGQLPVLTGVEHCGYLNDLRGNHLHAGFYANELLLKLLHRFDPHTELFDHYDQTVRELTCVSDAGPVLRIFEKQLLQEIGFGLILDHDVTTGEEIDPDKSYSYTLDRGPVAIGEASPGGIPVTGSTLTQLADEQFLEGEANREARGLIRRLLQQQLGGKEMRSRRVLRQLLRYRVN